LLTFMNPVEHCRDSEMVGRYRGEPYVSPGDVYSAPGRVGQCGWTWYSGSAAWMYRIWLEDVLGFRLRGEILTLAPAIPEHWDDFGIRYRYRSTTYEITARRGAAAQIAMELDGTTLESAAVKLIDDGRVHRITAWIPRRTMEMQESSNDGSVQMASLLLTAT
jgi:cyclic beta-1,2-glucan synthetase